MKKTFLILFILLFSAAAGAQEVGYVGRSPKALLMGDAYTAIADDEYTLFYNPAALGKNKGVSLTPLDPSIGATNVLGDTDRFKNFPKADPAGIAAKILNYPVSLQASVFPGLKMASFGFNLFASSKTNLILRNAIHPVLDVDYRYDKGFITGFAWNVGSGAFSSRIKKTSKTKVTTGQRLSIGAAFKFINREGMQDHYDLFGTSLLNKINSGATDLTSLKQALGYSKGKAYGADVGAEYAISSGNNVLTSGISILDVGGTRFRRTEGTGDIPVQEMSINTGVAFKQDFGLFDYTLSADLRPLNQPIDFSRKFHLGAEFAIPLITVYAGWSEGYVSYGASVKLWPVKLTAGFYGVEIGSKFREQEAKRFIVYLSLFDFSFDI
ncbi:MAG: hypothetical protein H7177_09490 [Rhizobacter sp.]|nr:hypothetical protein [Bacteriovorax sp.]